ncbi:MAG: hypothetical protein IJ617_09050 [Oscillospiraceae bacterium]|nr:hypothetical protein [Oscillospiraceae bacterium]
MVTAFRVILLIVLALSGFEGAEARNGHWFEHFAPVATFGIAGAAFIASIIYL